MSSFQAGKKILEMNKDAVSDADMRLVRHPREGVGMDRWSAPLKGRS